MKSVKPGRCPSMMGGIIGIFFVCIGVAWTVFAASLAPLMALFGVFWTGTAVVITVYHFKNATKKNRYSQFDIVDGDEEPDPLEQRFGNSRASQERQTSHDRRFCPFCGSSVQPEFRFCNKCGKKLP